MPSPPKPWEVNNATTSTTSTTDTNPVLPARPSTLTSNYNEYSAMGGPSYGNYGTSNYGNYGTSSYGTGGLMGSYNSPYSRMGGYGGGYNSVGYGNSFSPYNRMGYNNGFGMMGETPVQQMETSTRAMFDVIGSIVQAFGGFAQMLDSTYMATHSSFMAMVGVAEQFGNLRHYLGNIFNLFGLIRWLKKQFYKLTGKTPPAELVEPDKETTEEESTDIEETKKVQPSRRPVLFFLAIVTGLPYLIYKLIQRSHQLKQERMMVPQYGGPVELARVIHTFQGENPMELTIYQGDDIQVLSKIDPVSGLACDWWQGRLADGSVGIFPANHVQIH